MVFVADDLGGWLVGLLADAARKKLTVLVLGSDQERALRKAATAAVQDTAAEMSPSVEQAGQLAMVISEVFREPVPDAPLARSATLLEGLQAGIARQLAVLDDAGLTGTGQSSADVLGVPGAVLAEKLTDRLMREIMFRGSGGGPLTPLADQLNHDLTHRMLARLAGEGQDAPTGPAAPWRYGSVRPIRGGWAFMRRSACRGCPMRIRQSTCRGMLMPPSSGSGPRWRPQRSRAGSCCWSAGPRSERPGAR